MRTKKPSPPRDFRLFTRKQIARLSLKVLCAHLSELEHEREREWDTPNWWLDEVHESWRGYNDEYQRRGRKQKTPKPDEASRSADAKRLF